MQLKPAQINGIDGLGIAVVSETRQGLKECRGYFIPSQNKSLASLINESHSKFSGTLYDAGRETNLTFSVVVTKVSDNRVDFLASGDPYKGLSK